MARTFDRRYYRSPRQLWDDARWLLRNRASAGAVDRAFRERLMLAVTSVNRCRYCAAFHAHAARLTGVSAEEAEILLQGRVADAPAREVPALLYALHWAEQDGRPDASLRRQLGEQYGAESAAAIEFALRAIRLGNLAGNTWDAMLHRLSGGRLGAD